MISQEKADKTRTVLFKQLDSYWSDWNETAISEQVPYALEQMQKNYSMAASPKLCQEGNMIFEPIYTVTWAVFLYRLSHLLYLHGYNYEADCVYYLNRIMHSVDWFYEVELPEHFMAEHPLGSVLGKAKYSDYLFVYQGTTIGGNRKGNKLFYPQVGTNVVLYANATVLGDTIVGNNVIVSANSYVINEKIPNNCVVFGQSPNIFIKEKSEEEIREMTRHIWAW